MAIPTIVNFPKGPKIRVTLDFGDSQFKKASLSFSNCFECYIAGHAQKKDTDQLLAFLENYGKENHCAIDLNLENLSLFRKKALSCLQTVPFGEVLTYGELASKIGHPKAARAIGTACHHNPYPIFIPCHRVIAAGKGLGGFATGLRMKKLLLDFEKG